MAPPNSGFSQYVLSGHIYSSPEQHLTVIPHCLANPVFSTEFFLCLFPLYYDSLVPWFSLSLWETCAHTTDPKNPVEGLTQGGSSSELPVFLPNNTLQLPLCLYLPLSIHPLSLQTVTSRKPSMMLSACAKYTGRPLQPVTWAPCTRTSHVVLLQFPVYEDLSPANITAPDGSSWAIPSTLPDFTEQTTWRSRIASQSQSANHDSPCSRGKGEFASQRSVKEASCTVKSTSSF